MNSTKTISDKNKGRYSAGPFFGFTLKNNWQHFALYLILMLLITVLPCVMMINEHLKEATPYYDWRTVSDSAFMTCGLLGVGASVAVAIFSGMSAASYGNSKQMVGCYHSFPLRREWMFAVETSVRALYYLFGGFDSAVVVAHRAYKHSRTRNACRGFERVAADLFDKRSDAVDRNNRLLIQHNSLALQINNGICAA